MRGTPAQTEMLGEESRLAAYRTLVHGFFRPVLGQARWIDPRPLPDRRDGPPDTAVAPDDAWAHALVQAIGLLRVCVLESAEDDGCRGRPGGVLRFSLPYAVGEDTIVVYARYAPVRAGEQPAHAAERTGYEQQFWLAWRDGGWHVSREVTVRGPR